MFPPQLITQEGVAHMRSWELQQACRQRGIRAYGMTDERLRKQLRLWLELSLDKQVSLVSYISGSCFISLSP